MSARSAQRSCGICLHKIWNTPWRVGIYVCCWDGGCQNGSGLYGERVVKWDFPHSFFLFDIQSMRSTACVKVQIIWTCTSRWSGSIMSTARTYPLSKSMYLNIQRKYLINSILLYLPLWPRVMFSLLGFCSAAGLNHLSSCGWTRMKKCPEIFYMEPWRGTKKTG